MPFLRRLIELIFHGKQFKTFEMFIIKNEWQVKTSLQTTGTQYTLRDKKKFSFILMCAISTIL